MQREGVWRLGRRPELDGLRGIAVALVVVSHLSAPQSHLRFLGLDGVVVFFVLSGFLITSLLLEERQRSGRIGMAGFYRRRALRLAPAAIVMVAVVAALGLATGPTFAPPALVVGALTWSSNWVIAVGHFPGSALTHTWSLAIEEQFYLVWPVVLLVLARRGRAALLGGIWCGIALSACLRFTLIPAGVDRINNGSDTRADGLLLGCLVAVLLHQSLAKQSRPYAAAALLGLAVLPAVVFPTWAVVLVLPVLTAAATAGLLYVVAGTGEVAWLRPRWLTLLGQRSYGLYLWHWPVFVLVNRVLGDPGWLVLAVVALPLAGLLTWLSWRFVETPFLRMRHVRPPKRPAPAQQTGRLPALEELG